MNKIAIDKLAIIVKKGNVQEFLRLSNQMKILEYVPKLDNFQFNRVLSFYSILKIKDQKTMDVFDNAFLKKDPRNFSVIDLISFCSTFSKSFHNQIIWKILEQQILVNLGQFKKNIIFTNAKTDKEKAELGIVLYGFSKSNYKADKLWNAVEELIVEMYHLLNQKNLSMIILSYTAINREKNEKVFNALEMAAVQRATEMTHQNLLVIAFCLAKMKKGKPEFWLKWETQILPIMPDLKAKDLAQIIWSFCRVNAGTKEFWLKAEATSIMNCHNFTILDFNNTIYSFVVKRVTSKNLWNEFENYVKMKDFKTEMEKKTMTFEELLFISHIFYQRGKTTDTKFWDKIGDLYNEYLKNETIFKKCEKKFNYHLGVLYYNKHLWSKKLENIFKEMLESRQKSPKSLKYLVDMGYIVILLLEIKTDISEDYLYYIIEKILKIDASSITDYSDATALTAQCVYFIKRYKMEENKIIYDKILNYLLSPTNLKTFIEVGKSFSILIRYFSQSGDIDERFWSFTLEFYLNNINKLKIKVNFLSSLIIALIERNKIGFNYSLRIVFIENLGLAIGSNQNRFELMLRKISQLSQSITNINEIQEVLDIPEINLKNYTKKYEKTEDFILEDYKERIANENFD